MTTDAGATNLNNSNGSFSVDARGGTRGGIGIAAAAGVGGGSGSNKLNGGGKASVGLQSIGPDHNFANLSGKDNAVLFYTNRYADQPLVIKGAGAGADVTAAGVFADIIRAAL